MATKRKTRRIPVLTVRRLIHQLLEFPLDAVVVMRGGGEDGIFPTNVTGTHRMVIVGDPTYVLQYVDGARGRAIVELD